MRNLKKYSFIFTIGAFLYCIIELLWRGYTHISMAVAGGGCFLTLYRINEKKKHIPLILRCGIGAAVISVVELLFGIILNKIMKLNVWDYSSMSFNIMGQICPLYSFLWFLLSFPAFGLCSLLGERYE